MSDISELIEAVSVGDRDKCVKILASKKDTRDYVNKRDKDGKVPLTEAVEGGHLSIIEVLLDHGARIHHIDHTFGFSPILFASNKERMTFPPWELG